MLQYKKTAGIDIDPVVEAEAQDILNQGMAKFKAGQLTAALVHFADASTMLPLRSSVSAPSCCYIPLLGKSSGGNSDEHPADFKGGTASHFASTRSVALLLACSLHVQRLSVRSAGS